MKKHIFGRQLSRDTKERKALFKGLINSLVMQESIKTTKAKAKSIKGQVDKLITKAKRKGKNAESLLSVWLQREALDKTINDLSVRFAKRPGGFTRIISLTERFGDNAEMAIIEFVEKSSVVEKIPSDAKVFDSEAQTRRAMARKIEKPKTEKVKATVTKRTIVKKEKTTVKKQRPPSKSEMEKRKAGE